MIGRDDSVFPGSPAPTNTLQRLRRYLEALCQVEPGSTLTDLIYTPHSHQPFSPQPDMHFIPVRGRQYQLFPLTGLLALFKLASSWKPDLISTQNPFEMGLLGLELKWRFHVPLEVQVHFHLPSPYWLAEHSILNRLRLSLARHVLGHAEGIRVVSTPVRDFLIQEWKIPSDRVRVIPIPTLYDETLAPNDVTDVLYDPAAPVVLFVGQLISAKNIPGLIKIFAVVMSRHPGAECVILGDGPLHSYVLQAASRLDAQRIHILGNIPHAEVPCWYQRARVLVLPSLHEGLGRVLLESYLFKTPAVATRCGGPEDVIIDGETGFLTPIEDLEQFAERVIWLLEHPDQASEMGRRGQLYVRSKFDPDTLISQMVNHWQALAGKRMYQA